MLWAVRCLTLHERERGHHPTQGGGVKLPGIERWKRSIRTFIVRMLRSGTFETSVN